MICPPLPLSIAVAVYTHELVAPTHIVLSSTLLLYACLEMEVASCGCNLPAAFTLVCLFLGSRGLWLPLKLLLASKSLWQFS